MRIDRRLPITLAGTILLVASGCAYIAGGVAAVALSGGGGGGGKGRSNTPPVVGVSTPDGAVNDLIAIDYQLVDLESDRVDLEVTYSVAGGAEQPATQAEGAGSSGTTGLATSPTQTSYVFVWNSLADLGNLNLVDVRLHLTPVETFGGVRGETAVTGPFEARNAYMATVAGGTVGADLNFPNGAAVDPGSLPGPSDDVIYIADSFNNRVLRYDSATASTTIHAGTGDPGYDGDFVMATEASLNIPLDVALDPAGDLIICDSGNGRIRLVERSTGFIRTIAGGGALAWPDIGDGGLASQAMLFLPAGIDVDAAGNVYVVDLAIHRLRVIARQPTPLVLGGVTIPPAFIDTIAGDGTGSPLAPKGDGGLATLAVLDTPEDVAVDGRGLIYVTQPVRNLVRIINPTLSAVTVAGVLVDPGNIETFAGVGLPGDLGDGGPPTGAWLDTPNGIAVDAADNVYITDQENHRLKVVNVGATPLAVGNTTVAAGTLRSVCGTGFINPFGDGGPADQAGLFYPTRTAIDPDGHVLVVEGGGNRLRVINTSSQIETWGATPIAPGAIDTVPVSLEERGTSFSFPARVVLDDEGNLYFNDLTDPNFGISVGNQIWRLEGATGALSVVAGDGRSGYGGDGGPAADASLNFPGDITLDAAGNLWIGDTFNHRVRVVNLGPSPIRIGTRTIAPGNIDTVLGTGTGGYTGDGGAPLQADLNAPMTIVFDRDGNVFFAELGNHTIRGVNVGAVDITLAGTTISPGTVETLVGTGVPGYSGDGFAADLAQLSDPVGLTLDDDGNIFIADTANHRVRAVNVAPFDDWLLDVFVPAGAIETVIGSGVPGSTGDGGAALLAQVSEVREVVFDPFGNLWLADSLNHRIRVVNGENVDILRGGVFIAPGDIDTVVGTGQPGFNGDRRGNLLTDLNQPTGIVLVDGETPVIADSANGVVRVANFGNDPLQVGPTSIPVDTVGIVAGDPGSHGNSLVVAPAGLARDTQGNIVFTDTNSGNNHSHRVFRLDPRTRAISVLGGSGYPGYAGDGEQVAAAEFSEPAAVALDAQGNIYVVDRENAVLRVVNGTSGPVTIAGVGGIQPGNIATIAGMPLQPGYDGDGLPATASRLDRPSGLAIGGSSEIYIADTGNHQIRRLDPSGTLWRFSGNDPVATGTGPGEYAGPTGLHYDPSGALYVADTFNHRIQEVNVVTGQATVVVGQPGGIGGFNGDGVPPGNILLDQPLGVTIDGAGHLFVVDTGNHRLLVSNRGGFDILVGGTLVEAGLVRKVAGTDRGGFNGDALPAAFTSLNFPAAVLLDPTGDIYISDSSNGRVRRFAR